MCGSHFLCGKGKQSKRANVLKESVYVRLAVVQNSFFWHRVEICDKVLVKRQKDDGMQHSDGARCRKRQ